jgi:hypothetical protein
MQVENILRSSMNIEHVYPTVLVSSMKQHKKVFCVVSINNDLVNSDARAIYVSEEMFTFDVYKLYWIAISHARKILGKV